MLGLDLDLSILRFLDFLKKSCLSAKISPLLFFFFWCFFRRLFRLTLFFFLGCKICVGRDFFRLIFLEKKLIFLQNPKKRTRYIHEIFAVFQNNFRILSNVFASSKSQILVKGGFFAAVFFFFHFLAAAGHKIRLFIMGRVVVCLILE